MRKHPGVIIRQSMRWHSHVFWKVLEILSDLAMLFIGIQFHVTVQVGFQMCVFTVKYYEWNTQR